MSGQDEARAALARAQADKVRADRQGVEVHGLVRSLNLQLETNGFSVRLARAMGLDDDRR